MNQAAVSVKQRRRPDSLRGLFVHIMVRTVGRPCCSTPLLRKIKNDPKPELGAIFYAGEGGRTLTPLELVPKTSVSAIPPLLLIEKRQVKNRLAFWCEGGDSNPQG